MATRFDGQVVFVGFWVVVVALAVVAVAVVVVAFAVVVVCLTPPELFWRRSDLDEVGASDVADVAGSSTGAPTWVEHAAPSPDNATTTTGATSWGERQFTGKTLPTNPGDVRAGSGDCNVSTPLSAGNSLRDPKAKECP
ncbi:hypothetical protein BH20ACT4_BH20ACT4_05350 [soil metagenome]